ncbi:MAG: hypothetical protein QXG00_05545 [Candidatus Woesearchaeota archaeon]
MTTTSLDDLIKKMKIKEIHYLLKKQFFNGDDDPFLDSTLGDLYIEMASNIVSQNYKGEVNDYIRQIENSINFKYELGKISTILYIADIMHEKMRNKNIYPKKFIAFDQYLMKYPILVDCLKISTGPEFLKIRNEKDLINKNISDLYIEKFIKYINECTTLNIIHIKSYEELVKQISKILSKNFIINLKNNLEEKSYALISERIEGIKLPLNHSDKKMDISSWMADAKKYKIDLYFIHQTSDCDTTNSPCILTFGFKTLESISVKIFISGVKKAKMIKFVNTNNKKIERKQLLNDKGYFNNKLGGYEAFLDSLKSVKLFDSFRWNAIFRNMDRMYDFAKYVKLHVPAQDKIDNDNPDNNIVYFENDYLNENFSGPYKAIKAYVMCPFRTGELFAVHLQSIFDYLKSIFGPDSHLNYNRRKVWKEFSRPQTKIIKDLSSNMISNYSKIHNSLFKSDSYQSS